MLPELLMKKEYSGQEADLWAVGTCMYILLTGKMPFNSKDN
jgi:serine/threonine protein kinase